MNDHLENDKKITISNKSHYNPIFNDIESLSATEQEYFRLVRDTGQLAAQKNVETLSNAINAYQASGALADKVEFWKWMDRNYSQGGMFSSNSAMNSYLAKGSGKEEWVYKQLQGKGYEWDWMSEQRRSISNLFNRYDAGDIANRAASDVTESNILTGASKEYQMKAYTSKTNPNLKNTPKDMAVVTNAEKADIVSNNGYKEVQSYKNADEIKSATNKRLNDIKNGTAAPSYNFKNVGMTMAKAGLIGFAIGVTTETIAKYKLWKNGTISGEEYLVSVAKAGGNSATTGAITAGIMVPIEAAITAAGISCPITIPIAIAIGIGVDKIVAPAFGRGDYEKLLGEAKFYTSLNSMHMDLIHAVEESTEFFVAYIDILIYQAQQYKLLTSESRKLNQDMIDFMGTV